VTTYVALLRGINLGASNKIAMPALRAMTEELGYTDVATYINSGNLIFRTSKKAATVERALSGAIADTFGLTIDVMVRTEAQLKKVLDDNPYPDANPSQLTVAFLAKAPGPEAEKRVAAAAAEHEPFHLRRPLRICELLARTGQQQAGGAVQFDHRSQLDGTDHPHRRQTGADVCQVVNPSSSTSSTSSLASC